MTEKLFQPALQVIEKIEEAGFEAYIVGGAVRDMLLNKPVHDVDIATSAKPEEVMNIFKKVIPVGVEHGTVLVRCEHQSYEVTTFRTETGYSDFRRPDQVEFIGNLEGDLSRRDFTINAMAMNKQLQLVDFYQGQHDLSQSVIRTVGDPNLRFQEDPLRMMRAIRFASQLGFYIETQTQKAIDQHASLLQHIAIERISVEWEKTLAGQSLGYSLDMLFRTELYKYLPIIRTDTIIQEHLRNQRESLPNMASFIALYHLFQPSITIQNWIKAWKLSNKTKNEAMILSDSVKQYPNQSTWTIYQTPTYLLPDFVKLYGIYIKDQLDLDQLRMEKERLPIQDRQELAITGNDLLSLFPDKPKGPWIAKYLQQVERAVIERQVTNNKVKIREWLKNEAFFT
ncbi:CCA tRNA nucleotidyltransferase [Gracilibacillus sp. YIM 98692]|uniref:CCA tRNA nucleotidyltransferase n=1 Tax=Gracilibacillus sp. YIM 98692 TaxID=2663532 RepID=UPI0013D8A797|nr:CCA tRNA nucleotidyltransferase [Gracilibacillus sp. YIM 98692]